MIVYKKHPDGVNERWVTYALEHIEHIIKKRKSKFDTKIVIHGISKRNFDSIYTVKTVTFVDVSTLVPNDSKFKSSCTKVPLLYDSKKKIVETVGDEIHFNIDIVMIVFFYLSRIEEYVDVEKDVHGRFPEDKTFACRNKIEMIPVVDIYIAIICEWMNVEDVGGIDKKGVTYSFDIDCIEKRVTINSIVKTAIKGLVYKKEKVGNILFNIKKMFEEKMYISKNEYFTSLQELLCIDVGHQNTSIYYLMSSKKRPFNDGYQLSSKKEYLEFVHKIQSLGQKIGMHFGYTTDISLSDMVYEKKVLEQVIDRKVTCSRQHYLKVTLPNTFQQLEQVGIQNDSSLGFSGRIGYRCGTSSPFRVYDVSKNMVMDLIETPLIIMDKPLYQYCKSDKKSIKKALHEITKYKIFTCDPITVLIHNVFVKGIWSNLFEEFVSYLNDY